MRSFDSYLDSKGYMDLAVKWTRLFQISVTICPSKQGLSGVVSKEMLQHQGWDWESFVFCSQSHLDLARADAGVIRAVGVMACWMY